MEKEMRRTGNSFLSGKSRLTSRKSGKASDESSDEEENKSKTKSRVSLLDQQKSGVVSKSNFGAALSDGASGDDISQVEELNDRTKIDGTPW